MTRYAVADYGGNAVAVVEQLPGESALAALDRLDRECAERARSAGLGALICDRCDRPVYICRKDLQTCRRRHGTKRSS